MRLLDWMNTCTWLLVRAVYKLASIIIILETVTKPQLPQRKNRTLFKSLEQNSCIPLTKKCSKSHQNKNYQHWTSTVHSKNSLKKEINFWCKYMRNGFLKCFPIRPNSFIFAFTPLCFPHSSFKDPDDLSYTVFILWFPTLVSTTQRQSPSRCIRWALPSITEILNIWV